MAYSYEYNAYTTSDGKEIPAFEIFDSEGYKIADTNEDTPVEVQERHARLMAAAPDLLEALETIEAALDGAAAYGFRDELKIVRAAINQAKGAKQTPPATPEPQNAEYELYFDECERANRIPLPYDAWLDYVGKL